MPEIEEVSNTNKWGEYVGKVKWFNKNYGYGFVNVIGHNGTPTGERVGEDMFVHHTGVHPVNSNFRTLKKGEYINFNIVKVDKGCQAVDVTGIFGGPLQCDNIPQPHTNAHAHAHKFSTHSGFINIAAKPSKFSTVPSSASAAPATATA